jgi:AAA15 family ATPase/GTPase
MRIQKVRLIQFKRFDDLTIDLGNNPAKIIALLGPNGCGKSSVFDAFEQRMKNIRNNGRLSEDFYSKAKFNADPATQATPYNADAAVTITPKFDSRKHIYIRSSYRYTAQLNVNQIKSQPDVLEANDYPMSTIHLDDRLTSNYTRLLAKSYSDFESGTITGNQSREKLIKQINESLKSVLDIQISSLGNVIENRGQLWFAKGTTKDFPYANLSAGEKEILDLIVDLIVKVDHYDDTVFCIDEPELHINTSVQRQLLAALDKLIPDSCQLWIATHSIGFMRALQLDLAAKTQILDFSASDYFSGTKTIRPLKPTRREWQRIFSIALDDLSELVSPRTLIYCEGRKDPSASNDEQGLDSEVYNTIFGEAHPDTLFISSGGGNEPKLYSSIALKVLNKAFKGVDILLLKDRDSLDDATRMARLTADLTLRILRRHEIENYLLDPTVLSSFCERRAIAFDAAAYSMICPNIQLGDLKASIQAIKQFVQFQGDTKPFLKELAFHMKPGTQVYSELHFDVFGN